MSDGAAPRIDRRFDPRFQRGYVPDAGEPASAPEPEPVPAAPSVEATAAAVARPDGSAAPGVGRQRSPDPPAGSRLESHSSIMESEEELAPAVFLDDSGDGEPSRIGPWFAAGWAVAAVATVVGIGLWWASVTSENFYGPSSESERWLGIVSWTVAPSLIQAGLVAAVAMLVWSGVRHAGRRREERS